MLRNISHAEIEVIEILAKENDLDLGSVRSAITNAKVEPYGKDGSFRIRYEADILCTDATQLDRMGVEKHSEIAKTYVVLWVDPDKKRPCEVECFRIDGSDPNHLPRVTSLSFQSYADEFLKTDRN